MLGYYTNELHHRGYKKAICYLPHDGVNASVITGLRFQDHLRDAEFQVEGTFLVTGLQTAGYLNPPTIVNVYIDRSVLKTE